MAEGEETRFDVLQISGVLNLRVKINDLIRVVTGFVEHQTAMQAFKNPAMGAMSGAGALIDGDIAFIGNFCGNDFHVMSGSAIFAGNGRVELRLLPLFFEAGQNEHPAVKQPGQVVNRSPLRPFPAKIAGPYITWK